MRYDDLMILEGMFIDVSREDVKKIIREELAENLSYNIETFDFDNPKILLKKDTTDESYEIVPIKRSDATLGINIKRVKKEKNDEKFTLAKNIVYAGKEKKGVIVSTLETVETEDYTIFFENTKNIIKGKEGDYIINQENLGLWVYDNTFLQNERYNYFGTFMDTTCYGQFNHHERLSHIEKEVNKDYFLPDYVTKIETKLDENEKLVGTICTNHIETLEYQTKDILYVNHLGFKRPIYSAMEDYVKNMKEMLSLETSFDGKEKRFEDYKVTEKDKTKVKKDVLLK